jgi:hypothetical protein
MIERAADPVLVDAEIGALRLQPAFVEGVVHDGRRFRDLGAAYRHIFRGNLEWGILLWSDVPVRIGYREDLPAMVDALIAMLDAVRAGSGGVFRFETPNIETEWRVEVASDHVVVDALWHRLPGECEAALNTLPVVSMPCTEFLCEWKLLLEQLVRALADSGARLTTGTARTRHARLEELVAAIPERGLFYRHGDDA